MNQGERAALVAELKEAYRAAGIAEELRADQCDELAIGEGDEDRDFATFYCTSGKAHAQYFATLHNNFDAIVAALDSSQPAGIVADWENASPLLRRLEEHSLALKAWDKAMEAKGDLERIALDIDAAIDALQPEGEEAEELANQLEAARLTAVDEIIAHDRAQPTISVDPGYPAMAKFVEMLVGNRRQIIALLRRPAPAMANYQQRVYEWAIQCFGVEVANDGLQRNFRFLEEALELVQSLGCTKEDALKTVDYVFGRPLGEPAQEVGGVMVTLASLCAAHKLDMESSAESELARVNTPEIIEKIRRKQATKPKRGPLPGTDGEQPVKSFAPVRIDRDDPATWPPTSKDAKDTSIWVIVGWEDKSAAVEFWDRTLRAWSGGGSYTHWSSQLWGREE